MPRITRTRCAPLPPDQAVHPLTERAPSGRAPLGDFSDGTPIVVDSDSDISDGEQVFSSQAMVVRRDFAMDQEDLQPIGATSDETKLQYGEMEETPQTNEAFQALLREAQNLGCVYKRPTNQDLVPHTDSEDEVMASPPPSPAWRPETPPAVTTAISEARMIAFLVIHVRVKRGLYKNAIIRTFLPVAAGGAHLVSASEAYECLMQSTDVAVESIVSVLLSMDDEEIILATSRKPKRMDEQRSYQDIMTGYTELGRLSDLDRSVLIKDVINCDERRGLAQVQDIPDHVPVFVLYIWSDGYEQDLPSAPTSLAVRPRHSNAAPFIDPLYMRLFQRLVLKAPTAHSTFTCFMFVRIVLEACRHLEIHCSRGTSLSVPAGPHQLSGEDVVTAFCWDDNRTPYLRVKTFNNHRGWFFHAEQLYDTLLSVYPNLSQIHTDIGEPRNDVRMHIRHSKDLLKTPLTEAHDLASAGYGQVTRFVDRMTRLEAQYGIANARKKINHGQTAGSSKRQESFEAATEAFDEDMD